MPRWRESRRWQGTLFPPPGPDAGSRRGCRNLRGHRLLAAILQHGSAELSGNLAELGSGFSGKGRAFRAVGPDRNTPQGHPGRLAPPRGVFAQDSTAVHGLVCPSEVGSGPRNAGTPAHCPRRALRGGNFPAAPHSLDYRPPTSRGKLPCTVAAQPPRFAHGSLAGRC